MLPLGERNFTYSAISRRAFEIDTPGGQPKVNLRYSGSAYTCSSLNDEISQLDERNFASGEACCLEREFEIDYSSWKTRFKLPD